MRASTQRSTCHSTHRLRPCLFESLEIKPRLAVNAPNGLRQRGREARFDRGGPPFSGLIATDTAGSSRHGTKERLWINSQLDLHESDSPSMSSKSYDSKHVMVHSDTGAETIVVQWKRPVQYQVFRDGLEAAMSQIDSAKAVRAVLDNSILNLQDEDEEFFLKQWIPKVGRAGIQRLAIVVHRREMAQIPRTRVVQRLKSGSLTLKYFDDMGEAHVWVKQAEAA